MFLPDKNITDKFKVYAKKYNVKAVLSSWFYLHVNWFCEESDANRLFDLSTVIKKGDTVASPFYPIQSVSVPMLRIIVLKIHFAPTQIRTKIDHN